MNKKERNKKIVEAYLAGCSYSMIAMKVGLTYESIRSICNKELNRKYRNKKWCSVNQEFRLALEKAAERLNSHEGLILRTYNCLNKCGILESITKNNNLSDYTDKQLLSIPGFGIKSLELARLANDIYINEVLE